jgi:hypothetical protein
MLDRLMGLLWSPLWPLKGQYPLLLDSQTRRVWIVSQSLLLGLQNAFGALLAPCQHIRHQIPRAPPYPFLILGPIHHFDNKGQDLCSIIQPWIN